MSPAYAPLLHPLDSIDNLRDLGGRPAADRRPIKKGLLFRSAELSRASREDLSFLEKAGVAAVIDLRDLDEREARPDRLPEGAEYHHLPVLPLRWAREDVPDSPLLPQLWRSDVHRFFVVFYRILASSEETADMYAAFSACCCGILRGPSFGTAPRARTGREWPPSWYIRLWAFPGRAVWRTISSPTR